MNSQEFSNEFDILYNNIMSNQAPGLDEYEKSVFLTKAQDELLKNYFNPKGNKYQEGFDGNPKRQIDFSNLMKVSKISSKSAPQMASESQGAVSVDLPNDVFIVINEIATVNGGKKTLQVIPLMYTEYIRLNSKPYKQPVKNQAWRIITEKSLVSDLILGHVNTFTSYTIRYIKRPNPIILEDLGSLTIEGISKESECELAEELHKEILQRAVELAKAAYTGDINSSIETGKRSE